MIKVKHSIFIILFFILGLNIYLCFSLLKAKKLINDLKFQNNSNLIFQNKSIKQYNDFIDLIYVLDNKIVKEIKNTGFGINSRDYVAILFNKNICKPCIKSIVMNFSYIKQNTNFSNFIILGNFLEIDEYNNTVNELDNEFYHINISKNILGNYLDFEFPIIFIIEKNENIKYIYCPDIQPDKREWYFFDLLMDSLNTI